LPAPGISRTPSVSRALRGQTERLPDVIRERVLEYVAEGRAEGTSWNALSKAVGLSAKTLQRWQANGLNGVAPNGTRALVPVTVDTERTVFALEAVRVVLHSPKGWRIEGLDVDEAIEVLRALG